MNLNVFESQTTIPFDVQGEAFGAVRFRMEMDFSDDRFQRRAFVDLARAREAVNLGDVLEKFRWLPEVNNRGDIVGLEFLDEKLGNDLGLFYTIAPFVIDISFICFLSETGESPTLWRLLFVDGVAP